MPFKFNIITGQLDLVLSQSSAPDGFSWYFIPENTTVTIAENREMITTSPQTVEGTLTVFGRNTVL